MTVRPAILSIAGFVPSGRATAEETERRLGLPAGWIEQRTGVRVRPTAGPDEAVSDLAVEAGREALARADLDPAAVRLLLLATSTPDHPLPPTAPAVAARLGLSAPGAIDLAGACAGFLYALSLADSHVRAHGEAALVVAANVLTRRTRPDDRELVPIFADGAGAAVVGPGDGESGILATVLESDGGGADALLVPAGGSRRPLTPEGVERGEHFMRLVRGDQVFRHAVRGMAEAGRKALARAGLRTADVDLWIPHQANARIVAAAGAQLGLPAERIVSVLDRYGNSSAATIPLAMAHAEATGRLRRGQLVLLTAVGAGITRAALLLRY